MRIPHRSWKLGACGLVLVGLLSANAWSNEKTAGRPAAERGPAWHQLSERQQRALAPLQRDWSQIDAARKAKWLEVASRFEAMRPEERARVQERMADWARMSPAQRGQARLQYQEVQQWSAQTRQERWEAYQSLPADQRQALAEAARQPVAPPAVARPGSALAAEKKGTAPALAQLPRAQSVAPTVVQARPGASTTLVTARQVTQRAPVISGQPKVASKKPFVDPVTLLPTQGPQAAIAAVESSGETSEGNSGPTP